MENVFIISSIRKIMLGMINVSSLLRLVYSPQRSYSALVETLRLHSRACRKSRQAFIIIHEEYVLTPSFTDLKPIRGFWTMTKVLEIEPLIDQTLSLLTFKMNQNFAVESQNEAKVCMIDDWLAYCKWPRLQLFSAVLACR